MTYHYRKPPAEAPPWWIEWRIPLLVIIIVLSLLGKACDAGLDYYHQRRCDARAAAVLEPLNPWRRHVGLAPVTPALAGRDFDGDSLIHLAAVQTSYTHRYSAHLSEKHVRYVGEARQVLWEKDIYSLCPARCQVLGRRAWDLERTYTAGNAPSMQYELLDGGGGTRSLTRAEADSVLRYWKAQGARDSLAALKH
ncbi:MAG TPA: hypothetical protein VK364_13805 [Hymenobacter sp.]|nr:hypothetical protein [Hymenobacter sp.]